MIAVDTNVLVYAHRADAEFHEAAVAAIRGLAEGRVAWAIPWPCLHEFMAIVTHPRIFRKPSTSVQALDQLAAWSESPSLVLLAEGPGFSVRWRDVLSTSKVTGPKVLDARVAALCLHHGAGELWTADRDFGRFTELTTRNPLVA